MALQTIFEELYWELDCSVDSNASDQYSIEEGDPDLSFDGQVPSRPSSRLGFNRDSVSPVDDEVSDDGYSEGEQPFLHSVSLRIKSTADRNFTLGLDSDDEESCFLTSSFRLPLPSGRGPTLRGPCISNSEESDIDTEVDSEESASSNSGDEMASLPSSPPPIPIDDFPSPPEESDWFLRHKFSCLPSPLSQDDPDLEPESSSRQNPPRHYYGNHGHSRHALHHLKWFWSAREDVWVENRGCLYPSKPSYDIFGEHCPSTRERDTTSHRSPLPSPNYVTSSLPPLSIHPRRGDLFALRDPFCAQIDRYLVDMPLWTMSKILWMFDLQVALPTVAHEFAGLDPECRGVDDDLYEERSGIERPHSVEFSDDSDSTLVESDNEGDISSSEFFAEPEPLVQESPVEVNREILCKDNDVTGMACSSSSSSCPGRINSKPELTNEVSPGGPSKLSSRHETVDPPFWPKNWHRRWEILLQLTLGDDNVLLNSLLRPTTKSQLPLSTPRTRAKARKFFIQDDDDAWDDGLPYERTSATTFSSSPYPCPFKPVPRIP